MTRLPIAMLVLATAVAPATALDLGDDLIHLRAETYARAIGPSPEPAHPRSPGSADAPTGWIVAYEGPADESIREAIRDRGARLVGCVPSSAYLVLATHPGARTLRSVAGIERVDRVRAGWKLAPELQLDGPDRGPRHAIVSLFTGTDPSAAIARLRELGAHPVRMPDAVEQARLEIHAAPELVARIAEIAAVEWIEPFPRITLRNDQVRWVMQSNRENRVPLTMRGLEGEGQVIGHIDTPIAHLSCFFLDPDDPIPGPNHRKLVGYRSSTGFGGFTHGTHTAGTAAGDPSPINGSTDQRGIAPLARLSYADVRDVTITPSTLAAFFGDAHDDGAFVHTNSYGDDSQTSYTTLSRDIDRYSHDNEDDLVVFAASNESSLRTPENAKNCLAVGATRRAPAQHVHFKGGTGPTIDGRRKPEVYVPGEQTMSSSASVCSVVQNSGTSMAAPAVAGGAVLLREYFLKGYYPSGRRRAGDSFVPTGSLLKAMLVGSAVDMTDEPGYPSDREGWGRLLLENTAYFFGDPERLIVRDVRHAQGLSTGQTSSFDVEVTGSELPLNVTCVFADEPASVAASFAAVNDLDLEVEGPDGLFRGNVFDTALGVSVPGGAADPLNNVERVLVASPSPGTWTIRVRAPDVPVGPQGYAVVVTSRMAGPVRSPDRGPPEHPTLAGGFQLGPPLPNPFVAGVDIPFVVSETARVTLRVHDVRGGVVRTLVDRVLDPGILTERWNGTDDAGRRVAAGIYLVRFQAPGFTDAKKIVALR